MKTQKQDSDALDLLREYIDAPLDASDEVVLEWYKKVRALLETHKTANNHIYLVIAKGNYRDKIYGAFTDVEDAKKRAVEVAHSGERLRWHVGDGYHNLTVVEVPVNYLDVDSTEIVLHSYNKDTEWDKIK